MSGEPFAVTHPEMERYFVSIREALRLVLTAGTLDEEGEIYVLDVGKPIRIINEERGGPTFEDSGWLEYDAPEGRGSSTRDEVELRSRSGCEPLRFLYRLIS